jgi:impB/mucB/samB family C-terminal domain
VQSCLHTDFSAPPSTITSVPVIDAWQGWTHSVSAPKKPQRPLVESLAGIPKVALCTIFDKSLAQKIWRSARPQLTARITPQGLLRPEMDGHLTAITDHEILLQMITYLANQAAQTLRQRGRQACAVRLQFTYTTGAQRGNRALLLHPTTAAKEICIAAQSLLTRRQESADPLASVNLTVETIAPHSHPQTTSQLSSTPQNITAFA